MPSEKLEWLTVSETATVGVEAALGEILKRMDEFEAGIR